MFLLRNIFFFLNKSNVVVTICVCSCGKALSLQSRLLPLENVGPLSLACVCFSDLVYSNPVLALCNGCNLQADY